MSVPANMRYSASHEWVRDDGNGVVTVGITEFAQEKMTELVYVELPEVNREVAAGDEVAVVESVKSASDIYAPVGGVITKVNAALQDDPTLVNNSSYVDGWLFQLRVTDSSEIEKLMDAAAYSETVGE